MANNAITTAQARAAGLLPAAKPGRAPKPLAAPWVAAEVTVPWAAESLANRREHWSARCRRAKAAREAWALVWPWGADPFRLNRRPLEVTLTRLGGRALDAHDNLAASCKNLVDAIAQSLGVDDGDRTAVVWYYGQVAAKGRGVRVKIE